MVANDSGRRRPGRALQRMTICAALACAALACVAAVPAQAEEEKVLNIYNWSDYIAEDTIANFEQRTGIKVNYDVFDSNEVLEAKLLAGNTGYDLVVPTNSFLARQIKAGVFRKLDRDKLPNFGNLDPDILGRLVKHDPGNEHAIPYLWGTTGFAYNVAMIEERMPDAPVDSWDMMLKPEVAAKFADCGLTFLDAPSETAETVLNYLGLDPGSQSESDLQAVEAQLQKVRPYVKYFHSSQNINDLANGDICVAMGWSGDMLQARDRADEAEKGVEVVYVIPKEGAQIWFDMMAIPSDAPHPENAHLFLNYLMEPEVIAAISNYVFYANGNEKATPFVEGEVKEDPGIYPPLDVKKRLFAASVNTAKYDRLLTRAWTRVKTGQ